MQLSGERTWSRDSFLGHKTTFRPLYDRGRREAEEAGWDETLYANERDELTEGSISTLLLLFDDKWITPALRSGVLPGVARSWLLDHTMVEEQVVTLGDLDMIQAMVLCNSVRGTGMVETLTLPDGRCLRFRADRSIPVLT